MKILAVDTYDVRFPTSSSLDGSDAMNPDPDYSAAYVVLRTDSALEGHGFTYTIGRGNEVCLAAVEAIAPFVVGRDAEVFFADMRGFWRLVTGDSQLRWIGPEKGAIHLAAAAIVNAVWDLYAKSRGKPLWKLWADMEPEELVRCLDFKYVTDALSPDEAVAMLRGQASTKAVREGEMRASGYPTYTTAAGWLGYSDDKVRQLAREARAQGWTHFKMKLGRDLESDMRRAALLREEIGANGKLMVDANQVWEVAEAIEWITALSPFDLYWVEEPTNPDDVLGHVEIAKAVAPVRLATGEHAHNRVMFKQFLQSGSMGFCQVDACRVGGVSEALVVVLLARKYDVPVCPHGGGVGLSEVVQHLSFFDYIAVSGTLTDRVIEHVGHLHEHFRSPVVLDGACYALPTEPGCTEMLPASRDAYLFPR